MSTIKSIKENVLIGSGAVIILASIILTAWMLFNVPLFAIVLMVIGTVLSYIALYHTPKFFHVKNASDVALGSLCIVIVCLFFMGLQHGRYKSAISDVFLKGEIVKGEVFIEADGEVKSHYEDTYTFNPAYQGEENKMEIIKWVLMALCVVSLILNWRFFVKASNIKKEYEPKSRYSRSY